MASINYSPVVIRGKAADPIIGEILFMNNTIAQNLVSFEEGIKASTIFTESVNQVSMQAYTCGAPTPGGTMSLYDTEITPVKVMYYDEFCDDTLRPSRFNRDMKEGAWNIISDEWNRTVLQKIAPTISQDVESKFWNGSTAATKAAVGATVSGVTAREQSYVAASPTSLFDGIVSRLIYNNGQVGGRISVVGTTISTSNINTEYAKLYAAANPVILNDNNLGETPYIYAPYAHKQMINIFNTNATYRDTFHREGDAYFYNGIEIKFVPLPADTMILSLPSSLIMATDLLSDLNYVQIDKVQNNSDERFYKVIFTMFAHVVRQNTIVLYK